jgi:hypothetical protein
MTGLFPSLLADRSCWPWLLISAGFLIVAVVLAWLAINRHP